MPMLRNPYVRSPTLEHTRTYMGSLMSFMVEGRHTTGRLAISEFRSRPGHEPPPHIHEREDEFYYILSGSMRVFCGAERLHAEAGDYVFVPQGAAHTFQVLSRELRMVIVVSSTDGRPVGLDRYFAEMGEPAASLELPSEAVTHVMDDPARAISVAAKHGTRILSPDEAARLMPNYPGFGAAQSTTNFEGMLRAKWPL